MPIVFPTLTDADEEAPTAIDFYHQEDVGCHAVGSNGSLKSYDPVSRSAALCLLPSVPLTTSMGDVIFT